MNKFQQWLTGKFTPENDPYRHDGIAFGRPQKSNKPEKKDALIALYFKRKALEEQKKIELLDAKEAQGNKSNNWLGLYFKRRKLEEQKKIDELTKKDNGESQ